MNIIFTVVDVDNIWTMKNDKNIKVTLTDIVNWRISNEEGTENKKKKKEKR